MRPILLDSFCVPNVPQFTITTAASDFVPLRRILPVKPTKKGPKHNDAKTLSLFLYVLQLASCRPKPPVSLISHKTLGENEASERPSDRSTERSIDRAIQRPSDRPSDKPSKRSKPLVIFKISLCFIFDCLSIER